FRLSHSATWTTFSAGSAQQENVRHRLVLHRTSEEGRSGVQADSRIQDAGARPGRPDPASGASEHVRWLISARPPVVLEGGFRARDVRKKLCSPREDQEAVRPDQSVPGEPEPQTKVGRALLGPPGPGPPGRQPRGSGLLATDGPVAW